MDNSNKRFRDPYQVIEKKLELAELTIELSQVTREKWAKLEGMKDILEREETLLKEIEAKSQELMIMTAKGCVEIR